jgi:hypothetical protein
MRTRRRESRELEDSIHRASYASATVAGLATTVLLRRKEKTQRTHLIVILPYQLLILGGYTKILYKSSIGTLQAYCRSLSTFACRAVSGSVNANSSSSGTSVVAAGEAPLDAENSDAVLDDGRLPDPAAEGSVTNTYSVGVDAC